MFTQVLLPDTFRAIQLVAQIPAIRQAYLAGGTALALQLGHRVSVDLDFFTQQEFDENEFEVSLEKFPEFILEKKAWGTIKGRVGKTEFSLFCHKYPLLDRLEIFSGLQLAGKKDIAAMKIHALSERGTKRDFVDAYFLTKEFSLREMLKFYDQKYRNFDGQKYHILRALDYFEDAEHSEEREPKMLVAVEWEEVKRFFRSEVMRLAKADLDL